MDDRPFSQILAEEMQRRSDWTDEAVLEELQALPLLPDEYLWQGTKRVDNPQWDEPEVDRQLTTYLVLADIIRERKLREGVPLLLERASYGDMGETMRGLRHSLEAAFNPDWAGLNDVCVQVAQSNHRGARLWAIDELGVLRDLRSLPALINALHDPAKLVRDQAIQSLEMLGREWPEIQAEISQEFQNLLDELQATQRAVREALEEFQETEDEEGTSIA